MQESDLQRTGGTGQLVEHWADEAFRAHAHTVKRYLFIKLPPNEVDDAFSEIFEIASRSLPPSNQLAWLLGVSKNVALRAHSERYRQANLLLKIGDHENAKDDEDESMLTLVTDALSSIDEESASIIELVYLLNLDRKTVAQIRGVSRGTLDVRLHRARKSLAEAIRRTREEGGNND